MLSVDNAGLIDMLIDIGLGGVAALVELFSSPEIEPLDIDRLLGL